MKPGRTISPVASIVLRRFAIELADRNDAAILDADIGDAGGGAGAIDHRAAADAEVEHDLGATPFAVAHAAARSRRVDDQCDRIDRHAVIATRCRDGNLLVQHVLQHQRGIALEWRLP